MIIILGSAVITINSTIQKCVSLSSTEAEYVTLLEAARVLSWLRNGMKELQIPPDLSRIYWDNSETSEWACKGVAKRFHKRNHVKIRHNLVR